MRLIVWMVAAWAPLLGQQTLSETVARAAAQYAGAEVSLEGAAAAAAAVKAVRTAYLPKADAYAQVNRATRNNVYGMTLPNRVLAPISGPVSGVNSGESVWGSAAGVLVSWEPFDLGQRAAAVRAAELEGKRAERAAARTRFEIEAAAADTFLTVLAADATKARVQAAVERAAEWQKIVAAQAAAGLKPGADASRAEAELLGLKAQLVQAAEAARLVRVALSRFTGEAWEKIEPKGEFTKGVPPSEAAKPGSHPAELEQAAAVEAAGAREQQARIEYRPKFETQAALSGRGVGDAAMLGPHFYNWGVGFSVLFPLGDLPRIRAQREAEAHRLKAEQARLKQTGQDLTAGVERARVQLAAAREMAQLAPARLESLRAAYGQSRARYESGLQDMTALLDTRRQLEQAEIDEALARLLCWRAALAVAAAQGDLKPVLDGAGR